MMVSKLRLKHILVSLQKSSFIKNVFIVLTGTVTAQIIGFALTPVISRLFSPYDFGIFGSFNAVSLVIASITTLEYTQALFLPKEKEDAINLFFVSFLCTFTVSFLCLTFCLLAPSALHSLMKTSSPWFLILLVVVVIIFGFHQTCRAWCIRVKAFVHISESQVIRGLSEKGTKIGFGYLKVGPAGLILGNVLGDILASLNLVRGLLPDRLAFRYVRWDRMKQLAKDYRDFPMYSATKSLIGTLTQGLPVLLTNHFYGIEVAGAYTFGMHILNAPMGLILRPLRQVLLQKTAEISHSSGSLAVLFVKITLGLFAMALFPSLVLFIWAPEIVTWIFGSQWYLAGEFVRFLSLWMMFVFIDMPAFVFSLIIRIQRAVLFYDLFVLIVKVSALVLGGIYLKALHTVMLFALVSSVMSASLILLVGLYLFRKEGIINLRHIQECLMKG